MKFLVTVSPAGGLQPPAEAYEQLAVGTMDWMREEKRNGRVEVSYIFAEGEGFMIVNVNSPEELQELLYSNPSSVFLTYEARVLLEFEQGMERLHELYQRTMTRVFGTQQG